MIKLFKESFKILSYLSTILWCRHINCYELKASIHISLQCIVNARAHELVVTDSYIMNECIYLSIERI